MTGRVLTLLAAGAALATPAAAEPATLDDAVWLAWRDRFVAADGRVVDTGNGGISHSESQGYGLLLAAFADDRPAFDRIWTWTRHTLQVRGDGLLAWRYDPAAEPPVADPNNASDGDLLVAWALVEAAGRWSETGYRAEAAAIVAPLVDKTVVTVEGRPLLLPGAAGFTAADRADGPVVNPSYWVFPALDALHAAFPDRGFPALAAAGRDLVLQARFGPADLPSEWVALGGGTARPAEGFEPVFGYNAVRVPLYLAWAADVPRGHLAPFARLWPAEEGADPAIVDVGSGRPLRPFGEPGYRAVAALVACALEGRPFPADLTRVVDENYYPATLRLLALAAAAERYPACL